MGSIDTVTWQALTVLLTLGGLACTVLFWRLRGPASGLRLLAVTLLPAAAYLTGTLRLLWELGDAIVRWALHLTFSPLTWLGAGLAAVSVALFLLAGALGRRGVGTSGRAARSLPRGPSRASASRTGTTSATPARDDDMAEIEAILKRHGIS